MLLLAGVIGLLVPVSVSDGNGGSVACGNAIATDLFRGQSNANDSNGANIPILNQIIPHTDFVAQCESSVSTAGAAWAIPLAVVGVVGIGGALLVRRTEAARRLSAAQITRMRAVLRSACGSSRESAVERIGFRCDRADRLVLLDRRQDGVGDLVRPVATQREHLVQLPAPAVDVFVCCPPGASKRVVLMMLVSMTPGADRGQPHPGGVEFGPQAVGEHVGRRLGRAVGAQRLQRGVGGHRRHVDDVPTGAALDQAPPE